MVEKMKYISLTGHISHMNHAVNRYLSQFDIQLERTPMHPDMEPFRTQNPYTLTLQKATFFLQLFGGKPLLSYPIEPAEAVNHVEDAHRAYEARGETLRSKEQALAATEAEIERLTPFASLAVDIDALENAVYLYSQMGRISLSHFRQYEAFMRSDEKIIFIEAMRDEAFVWGVYLTPRVHAAQVNAIFASLEFLPITLSGEGTPAELLQKAQVKRGLLFVEIRTLAQDFLPGGGAARLCIACEKVRQLYDRFDVKKYASLSRGRRVFTFAGWIGANDARALEAQAQDDPAIIFSRNDDGSAPNTPTRLRNPPIIRQFDFFTRLYGLPTYGEADPTFILAITYTLMFGLMFGDVGHGLCLAIFGAFLGWRYGKPLGWILCVVGISAAGFGFLYGSIFGLEDVLPALWRRPASDITGTLIFAVGLGVVLIALSMVLYMYNALRQGRMGDFLFGANGAAGLVFYGAILLGAVRVIFQGRSFVWWLVALPLCMLAFKHPLSQMLEGRAILPHRGIGGFIFQTIMEMFETLLTYATNTISFVRVGAFAVSHAGMMHVVIQLSQGASFSGRFLVLVIGNLLVMGIEGLLVGIQVLRLDFYEIFSRFYEGGGRDFKRTLNNGV